MLHHAPTLLYHNYNLAWPWCPSSQLLSMLSRLQRHYYSTTTAQRHQHCSSTPEGGLQNLQHASYWIIIILVCALQYYLGHLCTFMKAHHIYASHTGFLSRLLCPCSVCICDLYGLKISSIILPHQQLYEYKILCTMTPDVIRRKVLKKRFPQFVNDVFYPTVITAMRTTYLHQPSTSRLLH